MATLATVVDDSDPNLYFGGTTWITDHPPSALIEKYHNTTMHVSKINGDFVEIKWAGTDIAVYGARRDNHGVYGVVLDSTPIQYFSGLSTTPAFAQVLFATSGLAQGEHTVRMTNEFARNPPEQVTFIYLDIDFVAFNGQIRDARPGALQSLATPQAAPKPTSSGAPPPPPPASSSSKATSAVAAPLSASAAAPSVIPVSSSVPTSSASASSAILAESVSSALASSSSALGPVTLSRTFDNGVSIPSESAFSSSAMASIKTSGQPSVPSQSADEPEAQPSSGLSKTATVAVSSTVIALAALVIITVIGLWWHRRRKRRAELEQDDYYEDQFRDSRGSWNKL